MVGIRSSSRISVCRSQFGCLGCLRSSNIRFVPSRNSSGWSQQADDQVSVAGKIVEVAGMDQHRSLAEQFNRQIFVGSGHGHAQYGIPSPFNLQTLGRFLLRQLTIELGEIRTHAVEKSAAGYFSAAPAARARPAGWEHSSTDRCRQSPPGGPWPRSPPVPGRWPRPRPASSAAGRRFSRRRSG